MRKILKQAFNFFVISGIGWIIDMLIYVILVKLNLNLIIANIISAGLAASYVYFVSTRKIFENSGRHSLKFKYFIYILYQFILIVISSYVISLIAKGLSIVFIYYHLNFLLTNVKIISKIVNTPVTMLINFIVMKNLIEKL